MIRSIIVCIFIYFIAIFQTTLASSITIHQVKPDLLFITAISISILLGPLKGMLWGLVIGMVLDILSGRTGLFYTLIFASLSLLSGMLEKRVFKENIFIPAGVIMVGSLIKETLSYIIINFSRMQGLKELDIALNHLRWGLSNGVNIILLNSVYNSILAPFIFFIIKIIIIPKDRIKVREGM